MLLNDELDDYSKEAYLKYCFKFKDYRYTIELYRIKPFKDNLNRKWKITVNNGFLIYVSRLELRKDNKSNFEQLFRNLSGYFDIFDCKALAEDIFLNIERLTKKFKTDTFQVKSGV
ncbi:hypothetical protein [Peribacillus asahii]|uniref:hypothetical protein n=1 Tax=Peribacillus asahii TaxID=228899 RepID=UPI00207A45C6|nr:hypothetical protein [Peribacillus asahii]USK69972.1 hypothetical protein LIS76_21055 [Peribacillus asahii]